MELCTHEKAVFFLLVNILTVWSLAFLATQHTTVCLDGSPRALEELVQKSRRAGRDGCQAEAILYPRKTGEKYLLS